MGFSLDILLLLDLVDAGGSTDLVTLGADIEVGMPGGGRCGATAVSVGNFCGPAGFMCVKPVGSGIEEVVCDCAGCAAYALPCDDGCNEILLIDEPSVIDCRVLGERVVVVEPGILACGCVCCSLVAVVGIG